MEVPNIIGVSGKIKSGKDTIALLMQLHFYNENEMIVFRDRQRALLDVSEAMDKAGYLNDASGWKIKKFAYKLKLIISMLTGIPIDDLEKAEVKDSKLGEEWAYLIYYSLENNITKRVNPHRWKDFEPNRTKNYTVRELLQYLGTELFRNQLHENVWLNALFADYNEKSKWIITDVRFVNEAEAIKKRGGLLIRVNNPEYKPYKGEHESETQLDDYKGFDVIVNNNKEHGLNSLSEQVKGILKTKKLLLL